MNQVPLQSLLLPLYQYKFGIRGNIHSVGEKGDTFTVQKGNLVATAWKDKKVVTYLSTNCDPTESRVVQRRKKKVFNYT
jgi:hypothetical protein